MKKADLNLKLQRHHGIRSSMLENGYLTAEQYMDEVIAVVEEFMQPKPVRIILDTPDGDIPSTVNEFE
jgi:hypothetical protein